MKLTVLTEPQWHPFHEALKDWCESQRLEHDVSYCTSLESLPGGDILFILSFQSKVPAELRSRYTHSLVAHASDLPRGRGWSPLEWQIVEGATRVTVSLIAAEDEIDSGAVYGQESFEVKRHELRPEIEGKLFGAELRLMNRVLTGSDFLTPRAQSGIATHYRRRTPDDSRIDACLPLADQFDILRIADPDRFPAFFDLHGVRYTLTVKKLEEFDD